uniref:Uncharacterized protein n=1 Tax=Fagus sylvatica TaxID=28930 RepID=A0A2N9H5A2_FAGSY
MSSVDHIMDESSLAMVAVETVVPVAHRTGSKAGMPIAHSNVAENSVAVAENSVAVADSLGSEDIGMEVLPFHNYYVDSHCKTHNHSHAILVKVDHVMYKCAFHF